MKQHLIFAVAGIVSFLGIVGILFFNFGSHFERAFNKTIETIDKPQQTTSELDISSFEKTSELAITFLKEKNFSELAKVTHPLKGIRFSPYAYISTTSDIVLTVDEIKNFNDSTEKKWGIYDGSGEDMVMSNIEYYDKFVYSADFINAPEKKVDERIGKGNTISNIGKTYPEGMYTEYHFSGFDEQYEGMDWQSLIVILEEYQGSWYVVGIVHDQWTV